MRTFTRLLAAGRSVMGIKKEPGPYRMNQEHLLPKFPATLKAAAAAENAGEESATSPSASANENKPATAQANNDAGQAATNPSTTVGRWFRWLANPFRPKKPAAFKTAPAVRAQRQPVQGELALETVKVVRNDLRDCDADETGGEHPGARRQPMGIVWNRLSARLLRQAVMDFNLVQKERGKFLSQAGSSGGGARGT